MICFLMSFFLLVGLSGLGRPGGGSSGAWALRGLRCFAEPGAHLPGRQVAQAVAVDEVQLHGLVQGGPLFRVAHLGEEADPALWQRLPDPDGDLTAGGDVLVLHAVGEVGLQQQQVHLLRGALPDHVLALVGEDGDGPAAPQLPQPVRRAAGHGGDGAADGDLRRLPQSEQVHPAAPRLRAALGRRVPHSGQ